jgi:hypothetical protein
MSYKTNGKGRDLPIDLPLLCKILPVPACRLMFTACPHSLNFVEELAVT